MLLQQLITPDILFIVYACNNYATTDLVWIIEFLPVLVVTYGWVLN